MSISRLPVVLRDGTRLQSGLPKRSPGTSRPVAGLLLRGVVTATYRVDDPSHPYLERAPDGPKTVYCDVLCYGNVPGQRFVMVPGCLVMQQRSGLHSGRAWEPRATTKNTVSPELDPGQGNPADWDGDHVVVAFLDGSQNQPIILGSVTHPRVDVGNEESVVRRRLQLQLADGDPDFVKHHGTTYGITDAGDFSVDTRYAHDGELDDAGKEPVPPTDGSGIQKHDLPLDAEFQVTLWDMSSAGDQGVSGDDVPVAKVLVRVNKTELDVQFVDSGLQLYMDDANGLIEIGVKGAGEKVSVDSKIQDELGKRAGDHDTHADEDAAHRHPLPEFPMPLIFGDISETFAQPLIYLPGQPPVNVRTGGEATPGSAPMDKDAGVGEVVPGTPPRTSDLFSGASSVDDTASVTATLRD